MVIFGEKGLDRPFNDTWVFDTSSNTWDELECIGDIPSPRSAHAATVIYDTMFVFGGRAYSNGPALGDLYTHSISNIRFPRFLF